MSPPPSAHSILLPTPSLTAASFRKVSPLARQPLLRPSLLPCRRPVRCTAISIQEASSSTAVALPARPSAAEVSRTILELSPTGTLSALASDGWPLGVGARFVVSSDGSPAMCLNNPGGRFSAGGKSSFHVQVGYLGIPPKSSLDGDFRVYDRFTSTAFIKKIPNQLAQSGARTAQCTLLGTLTKPEDRLLLKKLCTKWEKKFDEELDENLTYVVSVERVLCMCDIMEDGTWVTSLEYGNAEPDPLRNCAEKIVEEMNSKHSEDVQRLCNVHVDTKFQVMDTKMIWVDRLGFDLYLYSQKGVFEARIPFPREVTDEKGVKSTFNCMTHLAWEVEKSYAPLETDKVKILKKVRQII